MLADQHVDAAIMQLDVIGLTRLCTPTAAAIAQYSDGSAPGMAYDSDDKLQLARQPHLVLQFSPVYQYCSTAACLG